MLSMAGCQNQKGEVSSEAVSGVFSSANKQNSPIQPNGLFAEHMVLQREKKVPVWGSATEELEGKELTVSFAGQKKTATVKDGTWRVDLDPMTASAENRTMTITCEDTTYEIQDVRVGEVLLATGQSNMCFFIEYLQGETRENILADCSYPDLGFFIVPDQMLSKEKKVVGGSWAVPSPATIDNSQISTVSFLVARQMAKELKVPVGVVVAAYGGTGIESWIPPKTLFNAVKDDGLKLYTGVSGMAAYNGMVAPLEPFSFRAWLFYQGEGNSLPETYAEYNAAYTDCVSLMVKTYRERFEAPELPFIQVQLPSYGGTDADFTRVRLAQQKCDDVIENCYTTINYDTGNPTDIHPSDKLLVGQRMADMVLEKVYGQKKDTQYPKATQAEVAAEGVLVSFDVGNGSLVAEDSAINSLEVAGSDGVFYPATGVVESSNRLHVYCSKVSMPEKVRYGYRSNMIPCNFRGANGLPVKPFVLNVTVNV